MTFSLPRSSRCPRSRCPNPNQSNPNPNPNQVGAAQPINRTLYSATADIISLLAFGHDFDSLQRDCPVLEALTQLFPIIMQRNLAYSACAYWKLPFVGEWLDGGEQVVGRIKGAIDRIIEQHRIVEERRSADEAHSEDQSEPARETPFTVLGKMLERSAAEPAKFDHHRVVDNLITLFLAGADTTSITMTWMLYHVAKDTALQSELAAEVAPLDVATASHEEVLMRYYHYYPIFSYIQGCKHL